MSSVVFGPSSPRQLSLSDSYPETRLLFIAGLHRSGATLLEHWLCAAYDVSHLRAPAPESEGQHFPAPAICGAR